MQDDFVDFFVLDVKSNDRVLKEPHNRIQTQLKA